MSKSVYRNALSGLPILLNSKSMKVNHETRKYLAIIVWDNFVLYSRLKIKREIRPVILIILNNKRFVVSFPKASFNIALAIARTKALYMLAWNGMRSGCSSVPCNAAYTGCIYAWMRVRTYCLPILLLVILTISCRTFAFAVQCYEGWTNTAFKRYLRTAKG